MQSQAASRAPLLKAVRAQAPAREAALLPLQVAEVCHSYEHSAATVSKSSSSLQPLRASIGVHTSQVAPRQQSSQRERGCSRPRRKVHNFSLPPPLPLHSGPSSALVRPHKSLPRSPSPSRHRSSPQSDPFKLIRNPNSFATISSRKHI